jgi:hypothetical protein
MIARLSILLLAFALTACGSSPKTQFYTLDAAPEKGAIRHGPVPTPIEVGHVNLPSTLDRQSMVRQESGERLYISDQERWAAPLDELTRRVLTEDLRDRLPPGSVLAPGDATPPQIRTLLLNVQRFMADPAGRVALETDWTLQQPRNPAMPRHESILVPMKGSDGEAVAEAMSRALGELADRVVAEL